MRLAALLLLAAACTPMTTPPPQDWPALVVTEHYVSNKDMRDHCAKYAPFFMSPEACAEWNLIEHTCDIYYSADFPPSSYVIAHEQAHCAGYSH